MFTGKGVSLAYSATNLQYKYKISLKIQPMQTTFLGEGAENNFGGRAAAFVTMHILNSICYILGKANHE